MTEKKKIKPTVYIHMGMMKTGTTSIQKFCYTNNTQLEKHGIFYPDIIGFCEKKGLSLPIWYDHTINGCFLRGEIDRFDPNAGYYKKILRFIDRAAKKYKRIIFSEEMLWSWLLCQDEKSDGVKKLIKYFSKHYDAKVIIYLRRQDRWIESTYNQSIKDSLAWGWSFGEYLEARQTQIDAVCRFYEGTCMLADLVGKENVVIRPYEPGQFAGTERHIFSDFLDIFDLELTDEYILTGDHNLSLGGNLLEIKRVFNRYVKSLDPAEDSDINCFITESIKNVQPVAGETQGFLTLVERMALMEKYRAENAAVAREFLNREDGSLFYDENYERPIWKPQMYRMQADMALFQAALVGGLEGGPKKSACRANHSLKKAVKSCRYMQWLRPVYKMLVKGKRYPSA